MLLKMAWWLSALFFTAGLHAQYTVCDAVKLPLTSNQIDTVEDFPLQLADDSAYKASNCRRCGLASLSRIFGGENATSKEFPWMVQLIDNKNFFCGGTLIGSRHVLTAAHCVYGRNMKGVVVVIGAHRLFTETSRDSQSEERRVDKVSIHGEYETRYGGQDIAVLRLQQPIRTARALSTICLSTGRLNVIDVTGVVAGWGLTQDGEMGQVLNKLDVPIISNKQCRAIGYGSSPVISPRTICAGYSSQEPGRRDACKGDSGGPLMMKSDGVWYQVGIVSSGQSCGMNYGIYTRVSSFLPWIESILADDVC